MSENDKKEKNFKKLEIEVGMKDKNIYLITKRELDKSRKRFEKKYKKIASDFRKVDDYFSSIGKDKKK